MSHHTPPPFLKSVTLETADIAHGFFTRKGGVSGTHGTDLNFSHKWENNPDSLQENHQRVLGCFAGAKTSITRPQQTHSTQIKTISPDNYGEDHAVVDGLITQERGIPLAILTADCVPVLLYEPTIGLIGAVHAGWKGAVGGILNNTLEHIVKLGGKADQLRVALGPCIHQESYEVDPQFFENVRAQQGSYESFFKPSTTPHHHLFNLPGFVRQNLEDLGVQKIEQIEKNTYGDSENFFSYRRSTHLQETGYGNQISVIMLA